MESHLKRRWLLRAISRKNNGDSVSTELFISCERYEEIKRKYGVSNMRDIFCLRLVRADLSPYQCGKI